MNVNKKNISAACLITSIIFFSLLINCSKLRNLPFSEKSCGSDDCHEASPLKQRRPTSGRHASHIGIDIACETCHYQYLENPLHKNGVQEVHTSSIIVHWDSGKTAGAWENGSGSCLNLTCHAGSLEWYGGSETGCLGCHGTPQGTRRAVGSEFPVSSMHAHFGQALNADACLVCHEHSTHLDGMVDLYAQDNEFTGTTNGSGHSIYRFNSWTDLNNIFDMSEFCQACHDSNGATRLASPMDPFGNGNVPPDVRYKFAGTLQWTENPGTQRIVNSHHDIGAGEQTTINSKIECLNCHGSHTSSRENPVSNPFNTSQSWTGSMNDFCLSCHNGGTSYEPGFPIGVLAPTQTSSNDVYRLTLSTWNGGDGWMNTGEFVDNRPDPGSPGTAEAIILQGFTWDGAGTKVIEVKMNYGIFTNGETLTFSFCAWWDPGCTWDQRYLNGTLTLDNAELLSTLPPGASLLRGMNSCGYQAAPWSVGWIWKFDYHGQDSPQTWSSGDPNDNVTLNCIDCHHHHGSNTAGNSLGNPYSIKDTIDGTPYGGVVKTVVIDTTLSPGPNWQELCGACHGSFIHFTGQACMNCHQHGGIANSDAFHTGQGKDTSCNECGNGSIDGNPVLNLYEECDDGNTRNGDGCSGSCTIE